MNYSQRLVYNKLISGSFRVGVSQLLVVRALVAVIRAADRRYRTSSDGRLVAVG